MFCGLIYNVSWRLFHVDLRKKLCILLLDWKFFICLLGPFCLKHCTINVSLNNFFLDDLPIVENGILQSPILLCCVYFSLHIHSYWYSIHISVCFYIVYIHTSLVLVIDLCFSCHRFLLKAYILLYKHMFSCYVLTIICMEIPLSSIQF